MITELEQVVLTTDLPEYRLKKGDIGTVVLVHQEGLGYEVEFITLTQLWQLFLYLIRKLELLETGKLPKHELLHHNLSPKKNIPLIISSHTASLGNN
ncbi:MAG: hypothetical protein Fur0025_27390 [Oscillatoriaceae cyanobacterium]